MIRLRTLGTIDLRLDDGTVAAEVLAQPKRLGVLLYLATAAPHGFHRRDKLVGLFWPDADEERGRNGLSKTVHFLRRYLAEEAIITRGADDLAVNPELVWCDAAALESGALPPEEAVDLYRGEFADSFAFGASSDLDHWLDARRTRLRRLAVEAALEAAAAAEGRGDRPRAVSALERATQWDPLNETVCRDLMRQHSRSGNRAAAITTYQNLARLMRREFDARPSAETRALAEALRQTPPDSPTDI